MFAEHNYHFPLTIRPPTKMAEKTAAKNKRVSQNGLSTHNQDHESKPVTFSIARTSTKATIGSIPGRLVCLDSLFIFIITSIFQFAKHPHKLEFDAFYDDINIPYSFGTFKILFVVLSIKISFMTCLGTPFNDVILERE